MPIVAIASNALAIWDVPALESQQTPIIYLERDRKISYLAVSLLPKAASEGILCAL
jgi:hypothetical protein